MPNYINASSVQIHSNIFRNSYANSYATSIDCNNIQWTNNSIVSAFDSFSNLVSVTNISSTVTNMQGAFSNCSKLTSTPSIPDSVIDMGSSFNNCVNLTTAPIIPASVINMNNTFEYCSNLITAPTIPNSVTNMYYTFANCINLTGDIYIYSNNITDATECFGSTTLPKSIYIPFTYANGEYTQTYNSFIAAGYTTLPPSPCNAILYDISGQIITQWGNFILPEA